MTDRSRRRWRRALVVGLLLTVAGLALQAPSPPEPLRMRVTTRTERRVLIVTVVLVGMRDTDRWLGVHACAAQHTEEGLQCGEVVDRETTLPLDAQRSQYLVEWRALPAGWYLVTAQVWDADGRVRATGQAIGSLGS